MAGASEREREGRALARAYGAPRSGDPTIDAAHAWRNFEARPACPGATSAGGLGGPHAIGGTFYAQLIGYITPRRTVSLDFSVQMVIMAVLGGFGTALGPLWGAMVLVPIAELTRAFWGGSLQGVHLIVYGALAVGVRDVGRRERLAGGRGPAEPTPLRKSRKR